MSNESRLWEFFRDGLKGVPGLHMRRVENLVSSGDPDVDGCYGGRYFEIELKGCNRPKRLETPLDFEVRQSQVIWHRLRSKAGGNTWLYIRVGLGKDLCKYLVPGSHAQEFRDSMPTEAALAALSVIPARHTARDVLNAIIAKHN